MSNKEFIYWQAYFSVKHEREEKASKSKSNNKTPNGLNDSSKVKKTMGNSEA